VDTLARAWDYALQHRDEFITALEQHLLLVAVALAIAVVVGVPLGILSARFRPAGAVVLTTVNSVRVVPSLAILFLAIPYTGLGFTSAVLALIVLALPPVLLNTDAGFRQVDPAVREAARGMGMSAMQSLLRVEWPLALPVVVAGVRTATVEVIASATLAAFIGAGGLGTFVVLGFSLYDNAVLLVGAVPVALLALLAEGVMTGVERSVTRGTVRRGRKEAPISTKG
jgi:osmoprotectant transport system permease protein